MARGLFALLIFAVAALLSGCAMKPTATQDSIDGLTAAILALGPGIDPEEAAEASRIAHLYSLELAQAYGITDAPLIHNDKVIRGERERGLCNHWAEDLSARLAQEHFRTLSLHRAISPPGPLRIIHHTVVISKRGATMEEGIVLDPWRKGGTLTWALVVEDTHYTWKPRNDVVKQLLEAEERRKAAHPA
jgi:hypothetical protein